MGLMNLGFFYAAMPIEALHSLENGIFIYCSKVLRDERIIPILKTKVLIDKFAQEMLLWPRKQLMSASSEP